MGATGAKATVGATVGAKVGAMVGIAGATVGVIVGVMVGVIVGVMVGSPHHITPGKVGPIVGNVGVAVGKKVAVGQSGRPPPPIVGAVGVKGKVGATRGVIPGASVVAVGNVVNGGRITAKPCDDTRIKIVIIKKLMRKSLSDLI